MFCQSDSTANGYEGKVSICFFKYVFFFTLVLQDRAYCTMTSGSTSPGRYSHFGRKWQQ